jgi:hypothetical protein
MPITVTATTQPNNFEPVNAPIWFIFSGFTSGLDNFKYLIDVDKKIEPFGTTTYTTTKYKIPPRPNGEGWFSPNKILKGPFENSVNPFISGYGGTTTRKVEKQYVRYQLKYGWEYNPNSAFTGTYDDGGKLGLVIDNSDFQIDDNVRLSMTNKTFNTQYNTTAPILGLSGSTGITVDIDYGVPVINETGNIILHSRLDNLTPEKQVYNGTRQYNQRTVNFGDIYLIDTSSTSTTESFLYTYPQARKKVFIDSYETISFITSLASNWSVTIERFDIDGNVIGTTGGSPTLVPAVDGRFRWNFGVGPQNIKNEFNNQNYFNGVAYYTVRITTTGNANTVSETITYEIVPNCSPYDNYRIVFLNRVGGYEYFDFKMNHKKTTEIEKTEYGKVLDWNYSMGERGRDILSVKATENFEINSDWVSEDEAEWLEQLFTSPDVYVIRNNELYPIIITDRQYQSKNQLREQIFNITVNFKFAFDINLQNL